MRKSLAFAILSGMGMTLVVQWPALGTQLASGAPSSNDPGRLSTLMMPPSEVSASLGVDPGWRFTTKDGYAMAMPLCSIGLLGESGQVGSPSALHQTPRVHPNERAAQKAWSAIRSSAKECGGVAARAGFTIPVVNGYKVAAGAPITSQIRQDLGDLSQERNSKWSAPAGTESFYNRTASGKELAQAFFSLLKTTGTPAGVFTITPQQIQQAQAVVAPFLDPAFQLVRANGQRYLENNYVPADVDDFEIRDVFVTQPRDDIFVVRYNVQAPGVSTPDEGLLLSDDWQPRITAFHWDESNRQWRILSHANFSSPVAAICGQGATPLSSETPKTSAADIALGESLVQQWRDITTGVIRTPILHPEHQIQLADGQGWPTKDRTPIAWSPAKAYNYKNLVVTRNGDLIVVSFDAVAQNIIMEGDVYRSEASPRLITYLRNATGKWELISLANFNVPKEIPAGVDCVSSGT
jgi:hypothetical protein